MERPDWFDDAKCRGKTSDMFDETDDYALAREICADCPVKRDCVFDAELWGEGWGVRGGFTPQQRGYGKNGTRTRKRDREKYAALYEADFQALIKSA